MLARAMLLLVTLESAQAAAPCPQLAQTYCHTPAINGCAASGQTWTALQSGAKGAPVAKVWRCYSPASLNADKTAYKSGTGYCTRPQQIAEILKTCKLPKPPPPRVQVRAQAAPAASPSAAAAVPRAEPPTVQSNATEVFVPGELGYPCIRIPSIALAGDGRTLNAFAECRNSTGDGCEPLHPAPQNPKTKSNRDICQKQSHDGGMTWGPLRVIALGPAAQGNPVYDAVSKQLILQWVQLTPKDTRQMVSTDHGATWSKWRSVCGGTLPAIACGGAVGPGVGIQLKQGAKKGRLLFIGHFGAYVIDRIWFSDDHGKTYSQAPSNLTGGMDEAQIVELPSGDLLANMRNKNAKMLGRGVSRSTDQGSTWGPVLFQKELVSPVCMGSILNVGGKVFFANPDSNTGRVNGVIRASPDGANWSAKTQPVFKGAYGYSCLTAVPAASKLGLLWESDGPQCAAPGGKFGSSCRTLFSTFSTNFDE